MRAFLIAGLLLVPAMAGAQDVAPVQEAAPAKAAAPVLTLQAELGRLGAEAESLHKDLPNFACKETAVSQILKKKKVKTEVRFSADLRVRRGNGRSDETSHYTEVNGKPFEGVEPRAPFMVEGGFDQALDYFRPFTQRCYVYTLKPGRVDFESTPRSSEDPVCEGRGSSRGFALLNDDGGVTHVERTVDDADATRFGLVQFAAVDLMPVELNGKTYQLSSKMVAEVPKGDYTEHFEATYSTCHLFKATITIRPGSNVVPDEPEKP